MRLRSVFAVLALAALCAAGGAHRVDATVTLVDRLGNPVTEPVVVPDEASFGAVSGFGVVKVTISPAPWVMPHVTATSDNPAVVARSPRGERTFLTPDDPPGGAVLFYRGPGRANVTLSVGPPYRVSFRFPAVTRTSMLVGCSGLKVDADGTIRAARTPAEADVYGTVRSAERCAEEYVDTAQRAPFVRHFPYGAIELQPEHPLSAPVHAAQWRADVTDDGGRQRGYPTWLVRAKSGATLIYRSSGALEAAPAGGDFPPPPASPNPVARVNGVVPVPRPTFSIAIGVHHIFSVTQASAYDPRLPLLVGPGPRFQGSGYSATDLHVVADVAPQPYTLAPHWTARGPIAARALPDGSARIEAQAPGTGTVTAELYGAAATRRVLSYRVLSVGCSSGSPRGVAFRDDGTAEPVDAPDKADLYGSFEAGSFSCPSPPPRAAEPPPSSDWSGTPYPTTGAWYFPHGGVFFPDGDDARRAPPAGSPRGVPFAAVTAAQWHHDRTTEPHLRWLSDAEPCEQFVRNYGRFIPGCTTMADSILLVRTRTGRFVKILAYGEGPGSLEGLYQLSRADGTFAY